MKKMLKKWVFFLLILLSLGVFVYYQNNHIVVTRISLGSAQAGHCIRIIHLSDLQCKNFGDNQRLLINIIKSLRPDLIVFTGDLVDAYHYDEQYWRSLAFQLPMIAPVYFVSGNHEWWKGNFKEVEQTLTQYGVHVLRNEAVEFSIKNRQFRLVGIDDPEAYSGNSKIYLDTLNWLCQEPPPNVFTILLAHRPEYFQNYDQFGFNLVFAGHAHGGQFRIPFIGGILAPNQGFLPKYSAGLYIGKKVKMIVSRGLGNSIFPLRLFNYPEIVVAEI